MRLAGILGLAAILAGCTEPLSQDGVDAPPSGETRTETWSLLARGSRELNLQMQEGAAIDYQIASDVSVRWDVHSHAATGKVVTHASGEGLDAKGEFTAPSAGVYSIYVIAGASPAVVTVEVEGTFEVAE